jgi:hypothetical protein
MSAQEWSVMTGKNEEEIFVARSQYSEGPTTGLLDTGFSWFPWV